MSKLWKAKLKDGSIIEETEPSNWDAIKDQVSYLELNNNGQIISLPKNCEKYIQGKTASSNILNGECIIESRYIGLKIGNNIMKIRVNEKNNNISVEII